MSRAEFEEWLYSTFEPNQWQFINTEIVYKGWLAGRESMRDEAAQHLENCFGIECRTGYEASSLIKDLEP